MVRSTVSKKTSVKEMKSVSKKTPTKKSENPNEKIAHQGVVDFVSDVSKNSISFVKQDFKGMYFGFTKIIVLQVLVAVLFGGIAMAGLYMLLGGIVPSSMGGSTGKIIFGLIISFISLIFLFLIHLVGTTAFNYMEKLSEGKPFSVVKESRENFVPDIKYQLFIALLYSPIIVLYVLSTFFVHSFDFIESLILLYAIIILVAIIYVIIRFFIRFVSWNMFVSRDGLIKSIKDSLYMVRKSFIEIIVTLFILGIITTLIAVVIDVVGEIAMVVASLLITYTGGLLRYVLIGLGIIVLLVGLIIFGSFLDVISYPVNYFLWKKAKKKITAIRKLEDKI